MPARPSRNAASDSATLRHSAVRSRTIETRQTRAMTASAAANGNAISETTVTASAASDGQSFRKNEDIALGLACTGSRGKTQWAGVCRLRATRAGSGELQV